MITLLLSLSLIVPSGFAPQGSGIPQVAAGGPVTVRGTVELSPAAADAAAASMAAEHVRGLIISRAAGLVESAAPAWLPTFTRDQVVRRWLGEFDPARGVRIVARHMDEHDHGGLGLSYRTTLEIESDERALESALVRLHRAIPRAAEHFAAKCAGVIGFWLVLGLAIAWIDRLSRGYMTWRLRCLGAVAGLGLPAVALLIL